MTIEATLERDGAALASGAPIRVDPAGVELLVRAPGRVELLAATLTIVAPADTRTLSLIDGERAVLASSAGPGPPPPDRPIQWWTAEWRTRRPVTAIQVDVGPDGAGVLGRLRLAEAGPWYPPNPDRVALGAGLQQLPSLMATRLMIELARESQGTFTPATATITGVRVLAAARPADLALTLDPDEAIAQRPLGLEAGEAWTIEGPLLAALRRALADDPSAPMRLHLRSSGPGLIERIDLEIEAAATIDRFADDAEAVTLPLIPATATIVSIAIPADAAIRGLELRVRADLPRERPAAAVEATTSGPYAHRCNLDRSAAQAFHPLARGTAAAGLDLHLRPLTRAIKGTLRILPDRFGEPSDTPFPGAEVALELVSAGDPPWPSSWWSVDLSTLEAELELTEPWWLSLEVSLGELLWHLEARPALDVPGGPQAGGARHRSPVDPWRVRELPPPAPQGVWARTRVRLHEPPEAPPPAPTLRLRWRDREWPLELGDDGRVVVDAEIFAELAPDPSPTTLELVVTAVIAGTVTLDDLHLTLAPTRARFTFGVAP